MRSRDVHVLLYWSNFIDLFQVDQVLKLKHNFSEIDFKAIKSLTLGKVTGRFYKIYSWFMRCYSAGITLCCVLGFW